MECMLSIHLHTELFEVEGRASNRFRHMSHEKKVRIRRIDDVPQIRKQI